MKRFFIKHGRVIKCNATSILCSIFFICIVIAYLIYRKFQCNPTLLFTNIHARNGDVIQKFNATLKFKTYGELIKDCKGHYDSKCFDVRARGETYLRRSQLVVLRMLYIFDQIARKHDIDYIIVKGTLLGAYRGHASIPWDDDADVALTDANFKKLFEVARNDFPQDLKLILKSEDPYNAQKRKLCAGKLRDMNSCFGNCLRDGCKWEDGLMLDIFKLDIEDDGILYDDTGLVGNNIPHKYLIPTKDIILDGIPLKAPNNIEGTLSHVVSGDYKKPPSSQCPMGYLPIPDFGCDELAKMDERDRLKIFRDTHVS